MQTLRQNTNYKTLPNEMSQLREKYTGNLAKYKTPPRGETKSNPENQ